MTWFKSTVKWCHAYRPFGAQDLTGPEACVYHTLVEFWRAYDLKPSALLLANRLQITENTALSRLDRLVAKGWIEGTYGPNHHRPIMDPPKIRATSRSLSQSQCTSTPEQAPKRLKRHNPGSRGVRFV